MKSLCSLVLNIHSIRIAILVVKNYFHIHVYF